MNYRLSYAAGSYWLTDMDLTYDTFRPPIRINEIGAEIWKFKSEGKDDAEIAKLLATEYEVEENTVLEDIKEFNRTLSAFEPQEGERGRIL